VGLPRSRGSVTGRGDRRCALQIRHDRLSDPFALLLNVCWVGCLRPEGMRPGGGTDYCNPLVPKYFLSAICLDGVYII
jgi:hypothetical protein